jgi:hypothetical protein
MTMKSSPNYQIMTMAQERFFYHHFPRPGIFLGQHRRRNISPITPQIGRLSSHLFASDGQIAP